MFAVVRFPGSNDDRDMQFALRSALGAPCELVWHKQAELPPGTRAVLLPGGFSYGDYLRTGAMARFSPIMAAVRRFADAGGPVLGTCNGFQILCEAGLLPGALLRNTSLQYRCRWVHIRTESTDTPFTRTLRVGQALRIPISHGEGRYHADAETLARLKGNGQIVFRYSTPDGRLAEEANPNGSLAHIAGVCNEGRNVLGLMPHPERAAEALLGSTDGLPLLRGVLEALLPAS
ncbi:MAG TPA: phosphoribosylformylglycinamidine synthase subunit PurQ [Candidatus Methylomirabilis sp.]|nr:phosphoribosylformylglycinamidine synthase subunit PurQ [Candidatus Methylomirabilis sp.]